MPAMDRDKLSEDVVLTVSEKRVLDLFREFSISLELGSFGGATGGTGTGSEQALVFKPVRGHVSVGLVGPEKLYNFKYLDKALVQLDAPVVEFYSLFSELVSGEEYMEAEQKNNPESKGALAAWLANARKDRAYIAEVMKNHEEVERESEKVSRRAHEVLARLNQ